MTQHDIYLDNNATTFVIPEVREAMIEALSHGNYSLYEPREMMDENKEHFRRILHEFIECYPFDPALFPGESEEILTS